MKYISQWMEAGQRVRMAFAGHEMSITLQNVGHNSVGFVVEIPAEMKLDVQFTKEIVVPQPKSKKIAAHIWNVLTGRHSSPQAVKVRYRPNEVSTVDGLPPLRLMSEGENTTLACSLNTQEWLLGLLPFEGNVLMRKEGPERLELFTLSECPEHSYGKDNYSYVGHIINRGSSEWAANANRISRLYRNSNGKLRLAPDSGGDTEFIGDVVRFEKDYGYIANQSPIHVFDLSVHEIDLDAARISASCDYGVVESSEKPKWADGTP